MPLSHKIGIRDRRRVDVVQAQRLPRCGDPTRETRSERHTNALTNLLLNAARSSGNELIRPSVEHQHCDRVRIKYVLHPLQQLAEQFVNIECCQLAVGQGLKVRKTIPGLTVRELPRASPAAARRTECPRCALVASDYAAAERPPLRAASLKEWGRVKGVAGICPGDRVVGRAGSCARARAVPEPGSRLAGGDPGGAWP